MRHLLIVIGFIVSCSAFADNHDRNVAGKLTALKKPQVRIMTEDERAVASQTAVALDLDADPNEIVCRNVRAGSNSASRLKVRRCKTRAEYREEDERELALMGREIDDFNRRFATFRSATARQDSRLERRNRIRKNRADN